MKVFVAGATGVLGWRAVRELVDAGHHVRAVARTEDKANRLRGLGAEPLALDLFDAAAVVVATKSSDAIANLATHIPPASQAWRTAAWRENNRLRTEASANFAAAAIEHGARFVQESITFPYADAGCDWITENSPFDATPLVASVLDAEAAAARVTAAGGVGIVLRFAFFYGADSPHTIQALKAARRGVAPSIGRKDAYQSFINTDDAATAVVAALSAPAGTFNVGDDEPLPRVDAYTALGEAVGKKLRFAPPKVMLAAVGGKKADMLERSQRISNAALRAATNWAPSIPSVREGWARVVKEVGNA